MGLKSYYVVQVVPNTRKRTLYIVTAFIGEGGYKKGASQSTNVNDPGATPEAESVSTPTERISYELDGVNRFSFGGPVKPRGIDLHFLPLGENRGSPPSSRRRQQSTGLLH